MWSIARRLAHSSGGSVSLSSLKSNSFLVRSYCVAESTPSKNPSKSPSKVLYLRNIGNYVDEKDLRELVRPFGSVKYLIQMQERALLQMETVEEATSVVKHFSSRQEARLKNRTIFIQYSSHKEITPTQKDSGHILVVRVRNPLYQMTVSVFHRVFSTFGEVKKIIVAQRNGLQGMIQFSSEESASNAKIELNGREIFDGCCKMEINFSKLEDLKVTHNNEFARDFSKQSSVYEAPCRPVPKPSILGSALAERQPAQFPSGGSVTVLPSGINTGYCRGRMLLVSNLNPEKIKEDNLFNLLSPYGRVLRVKLLADKDKALVQMEDDFQAELAMNFLRGTKLFGKRLALSPSKLPYLSHNTAKDYADHPSNRFHVTFVKNCCGPCNVLYIGNLPPDVKDDDIIQFMTPHEALKVKIFDFPKDMKKQALVEFQSTEDATNALVDKQYSALKDLNVRLAFSKTTEV